MGRTEQEMLLRSCEHLLRAVLKTDGQMTRAWKSELLDDTPHFRGLALGGTLYQLNPHIRAGASSPDSYKYGSFSVTEEMYESVGALRFNRVRGLMLGDWQVMPEWVVVMT